MLTLIRRGRLALCRIIDTSVEFELRASCPRPTESEHGAIFRLRVQQAEAMDGRRAQRRQEADLMPWMACIPLMQEQLKVCAVLMGFKKIVSSAVCRRPKERGQFFITMDGWYSENAGRNFRWVLFADQKVPIASIPAGY